MKQLEIKIEHNVPMPETCRAARGSVVLLLKKMKVGDSFFLKGISQPKASSRYYTASLRIGIKLSVRKVEGGSRIWRVA